jgi:hypothetical protein
MVDELGTYIDLPLMSDAAHRRMASWGNVLRADPCSYCGRQPNLNLRPRHGHFITVDHIVALIHGGRRGFSINGTAACRKCNARKSSMKLIHFLNMLNWQRIRREDQLKAKFFSPEQVEAMKKACGE